ncbi:hypothetical protein FNV43_RR13272 [Rhamnella rubrinervis]|uniref:Uncharacterized protein n=1 Tax=Rhamnella rubrinervis TaxID=2594499 RepID=A0A8K0MDX8_9ROSA|nr:hypothetical protein FNV43_RR13272 [Rhamnella rubrinervis]
MIREISALSIACSQAHSERHNGNRRDNKATFDETLLVKYHASARTSSRPAIVLTFNHPWVTKGNNMRASRAAPQLNLKTGSLLEHRNHRTDASVDPATPDRSPNKRLRKASREEVKAVSKSLPKVHFETMENPS